MRILKFILQIFVGKNEKLQYHDVIGGLTGTWGNYFTRFFVMGSLFVASVIQLIASAR
jgi:hypothetical protein